MDNLLFFFFFFRVKNSDIPLNPLAPKQNLAGEAQIRSQTDRQSNIARRGKAKASE